MSEFMATSLGISFALVLLFVLWLKFHEHLHLHRHEHGPYSHRTDLQHIHYELSKSGMMRRKRARRAEIATAPEPSARE